MYDGDFVLGKADREPLEQLLKVGERGNPARNFLSPISITQQQGGVGWVRGSVATTKAKGALVALALT